MGPSAGLGRCGKCRPHRDSIPGPSGPQPVAILVQTTLPGPLFDPRTVRPVASRYTDYATWPTIRSPDRPARRQSLYRLRFPAHHSIPGLSGPQPFAVQTTLHGPHYVLQPVAIQTTLPGPRLLHVPPDILHFPTDGSYVFCMVL